MCGWDETDISTFGIGIACRADASMLLVRTQERHRRCLESQPAIAASAMTRPIDPKDAGILDASQLDSQLDRQLVQGLRNRAGHTFGDVSADGASCAQKVGHTAGAPEQGFGQANGVRVGCLLPFAVPPVA